MKHTAGFLYDKLMPIPLLQLAHLALKAREALAEAL